MHVQVCKYFLEAVEKKQYGWFWVCPNGGKDCHYRHALPPGYVLKSQMKALLEEETEKVSIEEEIENQVIIRFFFSLPIKRKKNHDIFRRNKVYSRCFF